MNCSKCGKDLLEDAKFCSFCGQPVVSDDENIEFDDEIKNAVLKDEMHQEFTVYDYDEEKEIVEKVLDYNLKTGILSITDEEGNIIFSEECDPPQITEYKEIIKTYYYINDFDEIDLNHIFFKKDKWKIYNLTDKKYFTVKQYSEVEDSQVISEFDSIDIKASGNIYEYGFEDSYGLIKFNRKTIPDIEESDEAMWEILPLANCIYSSIARSDRGFIATNNFHTDIINEDMGVIKSFYGNEPESYYSENHCHIAFENSYMIYNIPQLENMFNGKILYEDNEIEPENEYEIEVKKNSAYICSDYPNKYGIKKYGMFSGGELTLNFEYDSIKPLYNYNGSYLFTVHKSGRCGVYDYRGKCLIPIRFLNIKIHKVNLSRFILVLFDFDKKYLAEADYHNIYNYDEDLEITYSDITDTYDDLYWLFDDNDFVDKTNNNLVFDRSALKIKEKDKNDNFMAENEFDTMFVAENEDGNITSINLTDSFDNKLLLDDVILGDNIALYKNYEFWNIHNKNIQQDNPFDIYSLFYEQSAAVYGSLITCCKYGEINLYNIYYYNLNTLDVEKLANAKYNSIVRHKTEDGYVLLGYYTKENDDIFGTNAYYADIIGRDGIKFTLSLEENEATVSYVKSISNKLHIVISGENYLNDRYLIINKNEIEKEYKVISNNGNTFVVFNNDNKLIIINNGVMRETGELLKSSGDYIICGKDGLAGVLNKRGDILIPFKYSSIDIIDSNTDCLILNYFGKKGAVSFRDNKANYLLPCEYEKVDIISGSEINDTDCENSLVYINSYSYYFRVIKVGRMAHYDISGKLVSHFRMITADDSFI